MHLKYYFFSLFLTACLPTKTDHLIGESDRPGGEPDDPWVSTDTSVDGTPPTELEVDSDSIVITATNDPSEPSSPLMLSVDANKISIISTTEPDFVISSLTKETSPSMLKPVLARTCIAKYPPPLPPDHNHDCIC